MWKGKRKRVTFWCDETLYKAFKPVAQRDFGSVCCALEGIMAGIVGAIETSNAGKSHSGVNIESFVLNRNIRERRKYVVDVDEDERRFMKERQWDIDAIVANYIKMGESPSEAKIAGDIKVMYELSTMSVEDRIRLKDCVKRELTRLGK